MITDQAWLCFKSQFIAGRHPITLEAPFQHYLARIIEAIGQQYCTKREDRFLVDLETRCPDIRGKTKYLDITCEFPQDGAKCAIELKFKTSKQGAQDYGRIDAYCDIEALEAACDNGFDFGRFFMITDSTVYVTPSNRGVGTVFPMHEGARIASTVYHSPTCKGREDVRVNLRGSYAFDWEQIGRWFFLTLPVSF
jgi:hypothetical protein